MPPAPAIPPAPATPPSVAIPQSVDYYSSMARVVQSLVSSTFFASAVIGAMGCSGASTSAKAAAATGIAVAATGGHRALTKECWARCSNGYVCNRKSGLCEMGECQPACQAGYACTIVDTELRCVSQKDPFFNPLQGTLSSDGLREGQTQIGAQRAATQPSPRAPGQHPTATNPGQGAVGLPSSPAPTNDPAEPGDEWLEIGREILRETNGSLVQKWAKAMAPHTTQVTDHNQLAIGNKRGPLARYLNTIHQHIHPLYERGWLRALELGHDAEIDAAISGASVSLELTIAGDDGSLRQLVVLETDATLAFVRGALEAISRAAPFGAPPDDILSSDGNLYVHWQLFRDPAYACSTYFARPFILDLSRKGPPE